MGKEHEVFSVLISLTPERLSNNLIPGSRSAYCSSIVIPPVPIRAPTWTSQLPVNKTHTPFQMCPDSQWKARHRFQNIAQLIRNEHFNKYAEHVIYTLENRRNFTREDMLAFFFFFIFF